MNFSQLCKQWADSVRYQVKPSTYGVYLTMIEKHILPDLGKVRVTELNNQMLEQYFQEKQSQEYVTPYCLFDESDRSDGRGCGDRAVRTASLSYSQV